MNTQSRRPGALILAVVFVVAPGAAPSQARTPSPPSTPATAAGAALTGAVGETQTGLAVYYSRRLHGDRTASGEPFDHRALTTAHRTLPFGTKVRITNPKNNKSVLLRVNDRGPTHPGRIVDVSPAAAEHLGMVRAGKTQVKLEVIEEPEAPAAGKSAGKKK